jgi:hypothetical protein
VGHPRAGFQHQKLHLQVIELAGARGGVIVSARIVFQELDEVGQCLHRQLGRVHQQQMRLHRHHADRRQVALDHIGGLAHVRHDAERGDRGDQQRVAVGRRLGDGRGADQAGGPGDVVEHEGLAQALGQGLAHQARHGIRHPARGGRHDDAHRFRRPVGSRVLRESMNA